MVRFGTGPIGRKSVPGTTAAESRKHGIEAANLTDDMAYVITQPCIGTKDASCVEVCPVDCIHSDDAAEMYYIDPDECIDCGACVDPCPVDAIYPEDEVPDEWRNFIQINADYFKK